MNGGVVKEFGLPGMIVGALIGSGNLPNGDCHGRSLRRRLPALERKQATLLRRLAAGERVNDRDLDWANLGEEIEAVGRGELRAFESLLTQAIVHRLKQECWPDSARSRTGTARKSASGRRRPMRSRLPCGSGLIWGGSTGGPCSVCPDDRWRATEASAGPSRCDAGRMAERGLSASGRHGNPLLHSRHSQRVRRAGVTERDAGGDDDLVPVLAKPSLSATRAARLTASVIECASGATTACTPQTTAMSRAVSRLGVRPMTAPPGARARRAARCCRRR